MTNQLTKAEIRTITTRIQSRREILSDEQNEVARREIEREIERELAILAEGRWPE